VTRGLDLRACAAPHPRLAEAYLERQESLGSIRPEWRFAAVGGGGEILARVSYWGLPAGDAPCLLDVVIGADEQATIELLAHSLGELGIGAIDYQPTRAAGCGRGMDEPSALEACGFALVATQQRLLHRGPPPPVPVISGFALRSVQELAYGDLVPLVAAVRSATADRATFMRPDVAAEIAALRAVAHDPAWWIVACEGDLPVGFVLPIRTDGGPVIGDIGVVPSARGRGVGRMLLAHGTAAVLGETGRVGADVDDANAAMLATASAVGYRAYAARAHYRRRTDRLA
jgi:GNAT superfamily N-acetyltransferase